jgi:hypothetical protein
LRCDKTGRKKVGLARFLAAIAEKSGDKVWLSTDSIANREAVHYHQRLPTTPWFVTQELWQIPGERLCSFQAAILLRL